MGGKMDNFFLKRGIPPPSALLGATKSQTEMIRIQVEEILKQTKLMELWVENTERIAVALEKLAEVKHGNKAGKKKADLHWEAPIAEEPAD